MKNVHPRPGRPGKRLSLPLFIVACQCFTISSFILNWEPRKWTLKLSARFEQPVQGNHGASAASTRKPDTTAGEKQSLFLTYSPTFQRHTVVQQKSKANKNVLASYEFLDEAREAFPQATVAGSKRQDTVAGCGVSDYKFYKFDTVENKEDPTDPEEALRALALLAVGGLPIAQSENGAVEGLRRFLQDRVGLERFEPHSSWGLQQNYGALDSILRETLEMKSQPVVANFPLVCLYDIIHVSERLRCFLQPLPPSNILNETEITPDWPALYSKGYGLGWTKAQLSQALSALPHVLALSRDDVGTLQPTLLYYYKVLKVPYSLIDEARLALEDSVNGGTASCVCTFAFLRSLGLSWLQLRQTLQAFPMLVVCDPEPTWEMLDQRGTVRNTLKQRDLHFICSRLQVAPSQVQAMLKTHSRLSTYSVEGKIQPTLDALQSELGLTSRELQQVILRMPSLLGMSIQNSTDVGLFQRLNFFCEDVGMTRDELRKSTLRQPSLLQYSVEASLRPKLNFFVNDLGIPRDSLSGMIVAQPIMMGLSLQNKLRPTVDGISEFCGMTLEEVGVIVKRAPVILVLSWKRNLEPKLMFLRDRLGLPKKDLKSIVLSTPRILCQSIRNSLEPKLDMIEKAFAADKSEQALVPQVVSASPSMLVTTNGMLERRLRKSMQTTSDPVALSKALRSPSRGAKRKKRTVIGIDMDSGEVSSEYESARAAAKDLGTSLPNMYNICNSGRLWKGRKYVYGDARPSLVTVESCEAGATVLTPATETVDTRKLVPVPPLLIAKTMNTSKSAFQSLAGTLSNSPYPPSLLPEDSTSSDACSTRILVFVSGKVYPPDDRSQVRGTRRAGGIALYFPQFGEYRGGPELALKLRQIAEVAFAQIMSEATYYEDGIVLVGFPYLRPSRNRCELYACHDALKFLLQLLKNEANFLHETHVHMDVCTDSDYAWKLLHNATRLHQWGTCEHLNDFVYDGEGPSTHANPDLLHPLCRTYYRLVEQKELATSDDSVPVGSRARSEFPSQLARQVSVAFHHAASVHMDNPSTDAAPSVDMKWLHDNARKVSSWQYQRAKTAKW